MKRVSSGSSFETAWGYSRAVVVDGTVHVSGTTGFDYATMTISADAETQARRAFANVAHALAEAGASLDTVFRARYYVTDPADWPVIGAVAGEVFANVRPAATAMVVGLVDARMKVEIEVEAKVVPG